jgi:hypothetical protein
MSTNDEKGAAPVQGSCLCGAVHFEVSLPTLFCAHCHCSLCRRSHGAAFVTWFAVTRDQFRVTAGESVLSHHRSSDHATRSFCGRCGSSLFFESTHYPDKVDIVLSNMEAPIDRVPEMHAYFDHRAAWISVSDALPRLGGESGLEPL